ncbi:MAG: DUF5803 family protein [Halanaeroarchaeum sp.]
MKRVLALLGLGTLVLLAGCGGTAVNERALNESASYDWNTSTAVAVTVNGTEYRAVYTLQNRSEMKLSLHDELLGRQPVPISAVQFRYPNDTVVDATAIVVERHPDFTVVRFPANEGQFAYTAPASDRSVTVPVTTNRSHEVVLPPHMRISLPVFGGATPGGFERSIRNDRVHLTWPSVESEQITVDYYRKRDLVLFGAVLGALSLVGVLGGVYYRRQIHRLEDERSAYDLGIENGS